MKYNKWWGGKWEAGSTKEIILSEKPNTGPRNRRGVVLGWEGGEEMYRKQPSIRYTFLMSF